MKTTVVNIRTDEYDVKICRTPKGDIPDPPNEGCFGNPFKLFNVNDDHERQIVIDAYHVYFNIRIGFDLEFRRAVLALRGKRLACFCAPKPCHGDVIVKWLEGNE